MVRTIQLAVACVAVLVATAGQIQAGMITLTGAELNSDPNASFPSSRSRTVNGTSLDIGTTSTLQINQVLFIYDLFPAGILTASSPTETYTLSLNLTRVTDDHDIFYGLWDGTNFLTVTSYDGEAFQMFDSATSDGVFMNLGTGGTTTNYSSPFGTGSSFTTGGEFSLAFSGSSYHAILPDGSDGPTVTNSAFDRTKPISLLVGMNGQFEETSINSLSIGGPSITAVPEPSSLALFGIGACVAGVVAARRRRREKQQEATA